MVAVIGTLATVLTFAFGDNVLGGSDPPDPSVAPQVGPDGTVPSASPVVASASATASAPPPEPTSVPTSEPSTSPSPSTGSGRVIFKDSFRLARSEGINLDAGKIKIQSGVSITDGDGMDLYVDGWANGNLKAAPTPEGGQGRFFKSRRGTLDDCASLIERGQDSDTSAVPVTTSGLWHCFLTSEGRVAAARIGGRHDGAVPVNATVRDRFPPS